MPDVYEMHYTDRAFFEWEYSPCYVLMDSAYNPKAFVINCESYFIYYENKKQAYNEVREFRARFSPHPSKITNAFDVYLPAHFSPNSGINAKDASGHDRFPHGDYVITAVSDPYPFYDADFVEYGLYSGDPRPGTKIITDCLHGPITPNTRFVLCLNPTSQDIFTWQPQMPDYLKKELKRDLEIIERLEEELKPLLGPGGEPFNQTRKRAKELETRIENCNRGYRDKKAKYELFVDAKDFNQLLDYLPQDNLSITVKALKTNVESKIPILLVR